MATVTLDITDGDGGRVTIDGWEFERIAKVHGLTGTGSAKGYAAANHADLPDLGDVHPSVALCYLNEVQVTSIASDVVTLRLLYAQRSLYADSTVWGGSVNQVETNLDRFGNVMGVSYTYPNTFDADSWVPGPDKKAPDQSNLVPVFRPQPTLVRTRTEYSDPLSKKKDYEGTVNQSGWSLDPAAAAGTWLCTGIIGRQSHNLAPYEVTYSFSYRADTWHTVAVWIDPHDGRPPIDLVSGVGIKTYEQYNLMNFNNLGL